MAKIPQLNRRLVLQKQVPLEDDAGGRIANWVDSAVLWAEITPKSGRRAEVAGGDGARVQFQIVTRAHPAGSEAYPQSSDRLMEGLRLFVIDAVSEYDPQGLYLRIWAHEEGA